jgi:hypothetical protein
MKTLRGEKPVDGLARTVIDGFFFSWPAGAAASIPPTTMTHVAADARRMPIARVFIIVVTPEGDAPL